VLHREDHRFGRYRPIDVNGGVEVAPFFRHAVVQDVLRADEPE
jgi:hypothetical protein